MNTDSYPNGTCLALISLVSIELVIITHLAGQSMFGTVANGTFQKKLCFLGRILTLPEVPKVVLDILKLRLNMLNVDSDSNSIGFLSEILHSLETYNLMPYLHLWQRVSIFP